MSRLRTVVYSCKCCSESMYARRLSKNEAQEQIKAELEYTPAEQKIYLRKDYVDDSALEEEYQNALNYTPDYLKNPCGVCGKDDDPCCKYGC